SGRDRHDSARWRGMWISEWNPRGEPTLPHRGRQQADETILLALACGATVESAARQAGVAPRPVHRRLDDPAFPQRLQALRADMIGRTERSLTAAATEAVRTLVELLKPTTPATVRLGAARAVLEMSLKVREVTDLEQRLLALEQQLGLAELTQN